MRAQLLLFAAAAVLAAPGARVEAQAAPALQLDGRRIAPYSRDFRIVLSRNGVTEQIGKANDRVEATTAGGRPALLRIQTTELRGKVQVDSAVALWADVTPESLNVHRADGTLRLAFAGSRAWGTEESAAGSRAVERSAPGVLYNTSMLEFVIGALPLREGFTTSFHALDSFRAGMPALEVGVTVSGSTEIEEPGGRKKGAWVIDATMAGQRAQLYFDKATRQWLGSILYAAPGMEVRYLAL